MRWMMTKTGTRTTTGVSLLLNDSRRIELIDSETDINLTLIDYLRRLHRILLLLSKFVMHIIDVNGMNFDPSIFCDMI